MTNMATRRRFVAKCLLVLTIVLYLSCYILKPIVIRYEFHHVNSSSECTLPDADPFDKDMLQYLWHPDRVVCADDPDLVSVDKYGLLKIKTEAGNKTAYCCYEAIKRLGDNDVGFESRECFKRSTLIQADVFLVSCMDANDITFYHRLHTHIYHRELVNQVISRPIEDVNVLLFGVDSMSHLATLRHLPKTIKYLREELNSFTFKGHTVVGDNSYPNILAMLSGKHVSEVNVSYHEDFFDALPLAWKDFKNAGYSTLFAEDFPDIAIFNILSKGFNNKPTDHYLRPFFLSINKIQNTNSLIKKALFALENQNVKVTKNSFLCYQNKPTFSILIDYYKLFIESYPDKFKFAFSWLTEISHEYISFLETIDEYLYDFFLWLKENGHFDNSILMFVGDHGSRIDKIRNTKTGRIEVSMPELSIILPQRLVTKYPNMARNLHTNTQRLTSHYDTYETLMDILHRRYEPLNSTEETELPRGISLFRNIPPNRSCKDAGIPENYCVCYISKAVDFDNPDVIKVAKLIVDTINKMLQHLSQKCDTLQLRLVKDAAILNSGITHTGYSFKSTHLSNLFAKQNSDSPLRYKVLLESEPVGGMFEGTVDINDSGEFAVVGEITRTNRYGNQSYCISEKTLKPFCNCKLS